MNYRTSFKTFLETDAGKKALDDPEFRLLGSGEQIDTPTKLMSFARQRWPEDHAGSWRAFPIRRAARSPDAIKQRRRSVNEAAELKPQCGVVLEEDRVTLVMTAAVRVGVKFKAMPTHDGRWLMNFDSSEECSRVEAAVKNKETHDPTDNLMTVPISGNDEVVAVVTKAIRLGCSFHATCEGVDDPDANDDD